MFHSALFRADLGADIHGDLDGVGDIDGQDCLHWQSNDQTLSGLTAWQGNYGGNTIEIWAVPETRLILLLCLSISCAGLVRTFDRGATLQ